jgi:hypothetical protein
MYVAKAIVVVTAVLWVPCGIIGLVQVIKWTIKERRMWRDAIDEAYEDDDDEEVIYR